MLWGLSVNMHHFLFFLISALDNANNNNQNVENTNPAEPEATHMSTPVTPVRAALGSVQHLRSLLQSACDQPSSSLARYFQV